MGFRVSGLGSRVWVGSFLLPVTVLKEALLRGYDNSDYLLCVRGIQQPGDWGSYIRFRVQGLGLRGGIGCYA